MAYKKIICELCKTHTATKSVVCDRLINLTGYLADYKERSMNRNICDACFNRMDGIVVQMAGDKHKGYLHLNGIHRSFASPWICRLHVQDEVHAQ